MGKDIKMMGNSQKIIQELCSLLVPGICVLFVIGFSVAVKLGQAETHKRQLKKFENKVIIDENREK